VVAVIPAPPAAPAPPSYGTFAPYGSYAPPPAYGGYGGYGGYGPPVAPALFPMARAPVVRHTLTRRNWLWVVVVAAAVAAVLGALVGATVGVGSQQTIVERFRPDTSVAGAQMDIPAVLQKVEPAVVSVDSTSVASGGSTNGDVVEAAGTGMILTSGGEVLTNNHVVADATTVTITLFGQTQARAAHVIGTDPGNDLALVQINGASGLPTVSLGNSDAAQVGDDVLAIGNALALAGGPSVTQGIVSAKNRSLSAENDSGQTENLIGLLQTDAAINPGNSGGPLVDAQGQVIGMNTAVASSSSGNAPAQNIGFAIAIDSVKPRLAELRQGGPGGAGNSGAQPVPSTNTAYMGVTVTTVTSVVQQEDGLTPSSGALVVSVEPGSPAETAGLRSDDVIVSLNGTTIATADDLTAALHPLSPGDHVTLGIYRGPQQMTLNVTLGARPSGG
jgi:S1-C subfamily serine protease